MPTQNKLYQIGTIALWTLALYLYVIHPHNLKLLDFSTFFQAAARLANNENIYTTPYSVQDHTGAHLKLFYIYPPFLAALLLPLTYFSLHTAQFIWCLISYFAVLGCSIIVTNIISHSSSQYSKDKIFFIATFLLLCYEPIYWGIRLGQVDSVILLLLYLSIYWSLQNRQSIAAMIIGIASMIKMSPVLLIIPYFIHRQSKPILAFCYTLLVIFGITALLGFKTSGYLDFTNSLSALSSGETNSKFITDFSVYRPLLNMFRIESLSIVAWIIKLLFFILSVAVVLKFYSYSHFSNFKVFALLTCIFTIAAPTVHFQHLTWMLIPITFLALNLPHDQDRLFKRLFVIMAFYFAIDQSNLIMYQILFNAPSLIIIAQLFPAIVSTILFIFIWNESEVKI